MTDNEIIKALERLHKRILQSKCAEEITETEIMGLVNALELINRQKAEIERLHIEGLQINKTFMDFVNKQIAEAIKEFAKRLKENYCFTDRWGKIIPISTVDNLVKEMTEVTENDRA